MSITITLPKVTMLAVEHKIGNDAYLYRELAERDIQLIVANQLGRRIADELGPHLPTFTTKQNMDIYDHGRYETRFRTEIAFLKVADWDAFVASIKKAPDIKYATSY